MEENDFVAKGYFADREIRHFLPCIKDNALDVETATGPAFGLNERQLPLLEKELRAAGFIKDAAEEPAAAASESAPGSSGPAEQTSPPPPPNSVP